MAARWRRGVENVFASSTSRCLKVFEISIFSELIENKYLSVDSGFIDSQRRQLQH